ncbi:Zn-dependent hydrolase [Pseudomonas gessardii]|uniref:Hydantoinase/carbamoylase family amidase n=1 Tax=Pseudomonas gessardii TaxID=78544 RepID=A0ABS9FFA2_9PSED|nr:Zn-dependent hydrolase [Pseudomonas gessardii]MCF4982082.1 hydantoinase/carbamoylase family amidase [Pseudomonas gessardii]MCF4992131.1 hydantoinase/carbamoylase family amidase [Pseudomonas gessardii]MCF5086700.1 hydantoinase/carbamoylase family amidase [Pseudomonas gessardii]MCF5097180.1 hydantoinase/carbamoylase family amidase [Pseudomonas gessardii]MCF5110972.1 hydantoinase/carbamoylase family amidase [Pseudomonas gessardii]
MSALARVNGERLWDSLMEMAQIGGTPKGGVSRLALTDEDRRGRDLFVAWCTAAGCSIRVDAMGNIFARRAGRHDHLAPVLTGSHGDSQPAGGKFDGIYGVLAGLEVLRTLNDLGIETDRPIEVVNWTNEEGSRFAPAMIASGVYAGVFDLEYGLSREDKAGVTIGQALQQIGYAGPHPVGGQAVHAAYELHIEQGPILEAQDLTIGVVTGAQGQRWYEVELSGRSAHAGTTPMDHRLDALLGFARVVEAVNQIGLAQGAEGRATVGMANIFPNSRNVVPGRVFFSVEFRHPDEAVLAVQDQQLHAAVARIAEGIGLQASVKQIFQYAPIAFDKECVAVVQAAAEALGYSHRRMISGAGHDACYLNQVAPTAMIFVPCVEGLSHNEAEAIHLHWSTAGADVLLQAILASSRE